MIIINNAYRYWQQNENDDLATPTEVEKNQKRTWKEEDEWRLNEYWLTSHCCLRPWTQRFQCRHTGEDALSKKCSDSIGWYQQQLPAWPSTVLGAQSLVHSPWCSLWHGPIYNPWSLVSSPSCFITDVLENAKWSSVNEKQTAVSAAPSLSLSLSSSVPSVFFRIHNCFTGVVCPKMIILGVSMYGSAMFGWLS